MSLKRDGTNKTWGEVEEIPIHLLWDAIKQQKENLDPWRIDKQLLEKDIPSLEYTQILEFLW